MALFFSKMSILRLFFLFLSAFCSTAAAQQRTIAQNSSLTPTGNNSSWLSPSGLYAFGFYQIGNGSYAVGIFVAGVPDKTVVWTANRDSAVVPLNVTLLLTDGRLILRQVQGQDQDIFNVSDSVSSALMNDSGNFVLYNSNNTIVWQSFDNPTDTLLPGQRLVAGQQLFSSVSPTDPSTGFFRLIMQVDGTLVQYPTGAPNSDPYAYFSSYTDKNGPSVTLNLDTNGYMYLWKEESKTIIFNLSKGGFPYNNSIYRATVDVDGIFRLYSFSLSFNQSWSIEYQTTTDKCDPKGICGFNAYCTKQDTGIQCKCIPGFKFISPGNFSCERNFSMEGCKSPNQSGNFEMIENSIWEDAAYETVNTATKEECEEACRRDCNCEAALFTIGTCSKQRLPLKYGKRSSSVPNVALVKVGLSTSTSDDGWRYLPGTKEKEQRLDILIMGICLLVLSLVILAISGILIYINKKPRPDKKTTGNKSNEFINDVGPREFTYAELEQATNDFKEELGRGAFGTVYKGMLQDSQKAVAVKRLEKLPTAGEGEREFQNEMTVIGKTHHRNLVRLLGYCLDGAKRLLVYEFMSNGSLADVLFVPDNQPSWEERIRITCGIASGILYLHEECETQIIHYDIKPQNILMDENYCAKISDFGLAKLLMRDQTKTFTAIRGTKGYVAPEWHRKLPVTIKTDVYSFGIVLLEIICLRKNVDWSFPEDQAILEEFVYDCYEAKELNKLIAKEEAVDIRKLERMIKIALWCIQGEPSLRPSMKKVLLMLEGTVDIPIPPNPTSFLHTSA